MLKVNKARLLTLRFYGEAIRKHTISVRLLTRSLASVQKLLLHLTECRLDKEPRKQGRSKGSLAAECELFLQSIENNCVTVNLALPEKEESLFPDMPDLSESVLDDTRTSFFAYSKAEYGPFLKLCPKPIHRKQVFDALGGIAPAPKSDYSVQFIGNDKKEHSLVKPSYDQIRKMLQATMESIPSVSEDNEPRFVSATGMAVIKGSNIAEWKETYNILELDLASAWRPENISWGDCHLKLKHPIAVAIEEQGEKTFIASHDTLGISAFGATREEAMEAFAQEFTVLWHEIAEEKDENLTADAIELKSKLKSIVKHPSLI